LVESGIAKENANMFDEKGNASMLPDEKPFYESQY
jgi:hypothetical protein